MVDHQHVWAKEPPKGEQFSKRPSVDRRGDMLDVAHNSFWTSPEELKRLRLLREEDPEFENSSDWPMVVEWCSSCAITKEVKLVLPDQEELPKVSCELSSGMKVKRKRGGGGSRLRRLLAHQLMLSERWGLPLSRLLLAKEKTEAKSLKVANKKVKVETVSSRPLKQQVEEEEVKVKVEEEKEEAMHFSVGASTGGQTLSTPRSSQAEEAKSSPQPFPQFPGTPPFPNLTSPFCTHNASPITYISHPQHLTPPFTLPFFIPPPCGSLMPGSQWVLCGACHSWGSIVMS